MDLGDDVDFYLARVNWLPDGALYHDPNAYLHSEESSATVQLGAA